MKKTENELLKNFLSSINYDKRLAKYDIQNCIAWVEMLAKKKIIGKSEMEKVVNGLKKLQIAISNKPLDIKSEDIHFAIEKLLENTIKRTDKNLVGVIRTGRSRNDLVVNDERLYLKDEIKNIIKLLYHVIANVVDIAEKNLDIPMCGYTHLQPAQPVLFSHYILSFGWMLLRDRERLQDCYTRVNVSVLGSAAFAGTTFSIDRWDVAKKLGFNNISENSVDAVSDRDYIIEFISCCAIIMMHLSRMAEEFILWLNPNFGYISLPTELTSGSSIMPQKQNPDYLELIRAKSTKTIADLVNILALMKGLPLTYNRDMQEDKQCLFSTIDTVTESLRIIDLILKNIKVNPENLRKSLEYDYILATELANFLVREYKLEFKLAHKIVKKIIQHCIKKNLKLKDLKMEEIKNILKTEKNVKLQTPMTIGTNEHKFIKTMKKNISVENIINSTNSYGGTSVKQVKIQIKKLKLKIFNKFI